MKEFRAWDHDKKEWVKNFLINMVGDVFVETKDKGLYASYSIKKILNVSLEELSDSQSKDGKKLFDGDIVRGHKDYDDKLMVSEIVNGDIADSGFGWEGEDLWDYDDLELLGNIHENLELLGKEGWKYHEGEEL